MTPKEQYEARKADRKKLEDMDYQLCTRTEQTMMLDTFDRFVTAIERMADATERIAVNLSRGSAGGVR